MYTIIWRYSVPAPRREEFIRAYGTSGTWGELFSSSPGFLGVELVALEGGDEYLTIDRWEDRAAFDSFMAEHRDRYQRIDEEMAALTTAEELLGRGTSISGGFAGGHADLGQ